MTRYNCLRAVVLTLGVGALTGCMPKYTIEQLKEMMPERPIELDKLAMFLGEWEGTSETTLCVLDEPLSGTGSRTMEWTLDKRYLVEHGDYDMGELGKMKGVGLWTYDPKAKKYRIWWFDSQGGTARGTATFCDETKTWKMKVKGRNPWGKSKGKGTVTFVDDDTIEWEWSEWDGSGLFKTAETTGTSKRK
ncbi:MAG: DUF1579 family protein [Phycisphaerae bacterium]